MNSHSDRFQKCKELWECIKHLDVLATSSELKEAVQKYKADVASLIIPALIEEVMNCKENTATQIAQCDQLAKQQIDILRQVANAYRDC